MASKAPSKDSFDFRFSQEYCDNIEVTSGGKTAELRIQYPLSDPELELKRASGVVLSSVPLRGSCQFEVKLTEKNRYGYFFGGVTIGLVFFEANELLQNYLLQNIPLSDYPNCCVWCIYSKTIFEIVNGEKINSINCKYKFHEGDTVGFKITTNGSLSFSFNGGYVDSSMTICNKSGNMEMYAAVGLNYFVDSIQIVKAVMEDDTVSNRKELVMEKTVSNKEEYSFFGRILKMSEKSKQDKTVAGLQKELEKSKSETNRYKTSHQQEQKHHLQTIQDYEKSKLETTRYKTLYEQEQRDHQLTKDRMPFEHIKLEETTSSYANSWKITHKDITLTPSELGRGGWGVITLGFFREQKVAVKQLYKIIMNDNTLAIMHREISTMSRLRHPNLLLFIGAALDHPSGNPLIITELMDTSLRQAYEKNQITMSNTKLSVLRDTAAGLNYLHRHPDEIIHRDVSSANVLLESRGTNKWRAKLSDFGSANIARNAFTQAPGAAIYSAPESLATVAIISKRPQQTTKMDVFSFGVLMCEVMTSRFPDMDKFHDMLQSITHGSPPIGKLIQSCISEQPKNRPTMIQVIKQMDNYMKQ